MDSNFLTPEQVAVLSNAFGGSEKENALEEQLALAKTLRGGIGKQQHSTGLGGLFGAAADVLNGYNSKKMFDGAQGQRQSNMDAHRAAYQMMLDQLNRSGQLSKMMGGGMSGQAPAQPQDDGQPQYAPLMGVPDYNKGSYT